MAKGNKNNNLLSALLFPIVTVLSGILLLIFGGGVINIALYVIGAILMVSGILAIVKKDYIKGVIMIVVGIVIIFLGWKLVEIALIVLGVLLAVVGVYNIVKLIMDKKASFKNVLAPVVILIVGVLLLVVGLGVLDFIVYVAGVLLIVYGVYQIILVLMNK